MKNIIPWFHLIRFVDCLGAFLCTFVGGVIARADIQALLIGSVIIGMVVAATNIINDVVDLKSDLINKSHRPIPAGSISISAAVYSSIFIASLSILLAVFFLPKNFWLIVILLNVLGYLYTPFFKKIPLIGHLVVAGMSGFTIIFGALIADDARKAIFPALTITLVLLNREIMKTIEDMKGDSLVGVHTIPNSYGLNNAFILAFIVGIGAMVTAIIPFIIIPNHLVYLLLVALIIHFPFFYGCMIVLRDGPNPDSLNSYMKWTRVLFVTGPITFLFLT